MSKKKTPKWASSPDLQKEPRLDVRNSPSETQRISWHIKRLDADGPWGWSGIEKKTLWAFIIAKLASFETMTWQEIIGKTGSHSISKNALCPEAQKRLSAIKQDDVDEIFSLRLGGTPRVLGIRDRNILSILWWDPNHQVCPSKKKNT